MHLPLAGVVVGLAVTIMIPAPSAQRAAPATLPTGDQILANYEKALGGADALARVTTRTVRTRRIVDIGTPSDHYLVRHSKRGTGGVPLSIMHHGALDGTFLRWSRGCDGTTGWTFGEAGDIRDAATSSGGLCEQNLFFYGYFVLDRTRMQQAYQRLEVQGIHQIVQAEPGRFGALAGGEGPELVGPSPREVYLTLGVPARQGDMFQWLHFDTETGLLLRRADAGTGATPIPAGDTTRIVDFIQYRAVGNGTVMPFQFVTQTPNTRVRGIHTAIEDNAPIDDSTFVKPKSATRQDKGL